MPRSVPKVPKPFVALPPGGALKRKLDDLKRRGPDKTPATSKKKKKR